MYEHQANSTTLMVVQCTDYIKQRDQLSGKYVIEMTDTDKNVCVIGNW